MTKEEPPYDFKVLIYMNEAEDLDAINIRVRQKLEEYSCQKIEHSSF